MTGDPRSSRRLAARAVHRVTPDEVGRRVSIRHLPDGPDGAARDVVARLLGYRDGVLALVDRRGQLVLVDEAAIVASRVVPEHPRLAAEPTDVGTEDRPLTRDAARTLLLDPRDRVRLVCHRASADRRVWTAPGGGLEAGESFVDAARRELREELAVDLDPGPWVWSRRVTFSFAGVWLEQTERWFLTRTATADGHDTAPAPLGDPGLESDRWWTLDELRRTDQVLAPSAIADRLAELLRDGPPPRPVDVGR